MPVCRYRGGGDCWCVSAVGEVVAQAGPAPPCPAGDAGLVAGGEGTPGADLADVGGHEQQGSEDRLGGDAADAAPCGLGEGFAGGGCGGGGFGGAFGAFGGCGEGGRIIGPGGGAGGAGPGGPGPGSGNPHP